MGSSCASGAVEILNLRQPFITCISKEVQVDWWVKLQKLHVFKEKDNKQVICCYYIKKSMIHPEYFDASNIFSNPFIKNLKHNPNMVQDLSRQMKIVLKKMRLENSFE